MLVWLKQDPAWVSEILHWQWVFAAARLALTSSYLLGGLTKLFNFSAAIAEQERFGLRPGWLCAALTILIELGALHSSYPAMRFGWAPARWDV